MLNIIHYVYYVKSVKKSSMASVQQIVIKELEQSPYILDLLQQELANVSAISAKLLPAIERQVGKKVKLTTIGMAIKRYAETLEGHEILSWAFPKELEIASRSDIYEVAIERTSDINKKLILLGDELNTRKGHFLSIVEGTYEIVIISNQKNQSIIKDCLKDCKITSELSNLAYVSVNWEKVTKDIPGIYYRITRALAFKRISIQSFHTIGSEMMLIFKEDVFLEAYEAISELLEKES